MGKAFGGIGRPLLDDLPLRPFVFDAVEHVLTRDGVPVRLTLKSSELLLALLESAGRVVTKEQLIQQVWPSTFVEDGSLTFHIHQVR